MITVSILVNGRPVFTRTAVNTKKTLPNGQTLYEVDDGGIIKHDKEDRAKELAIKMIEGIHEYSHEPKRKIKTPRKDMSVADLGPSEEETKELVDVYEAGKEKPIAKIPVNKKTNTKPRKKPGPKTKTERLAAVGLKLESTVGTPIKKVKGGKKPPLKKRPKKELKVLSTHTLNLSAIREHEKKQKKPKRKKFMGIF